MAGDFFLSQLGYVTGICWVEARDAAEHPPVHRTVPTQCQIVSVGLQWARLPLLGVVQFGLISVATC